MNAGLTDQFKSRVDLLRKRHESVLNRMGLPWVGLPNPSKLQSEPLSGQEASMLDTVMLMSELDIRDIRDIRTARRSRAVRRANVEQMTISRAGFMVLAALLMTAIWAPIIYGVALLFGAAMELSVLLRILGVIFFVSLFALSLAVSTSENSDPDDSSRR
jgi:hypothetical protein